MTITSPSTPQKPGVGGMKPPAPCGPVSESVISHLRGGTRTPIECTDDQIQYTGSRDFQLALWTTYELSYRSFDGVDDDVEWDPALLALRGRLERHFESRLRETWHASGRPTEFGPLLDSFADEPSVADHIRTTATADDVREILAQKSIYHLKESDPQCFVIPRLDPVPKAALLELQFDEFGAGDPARLHAQLFADALTAAGLDPRYGAYIDVATAETLAINNAMSLLCMRHRLRFAAMGHLAAFEATSSLPCAAIVHGLRRLGFDETVVRYFDEHVEADAVHEHLARRDVCDPMTGGDPELEAEVVFGAFVCLELERLSAEALLESRWPA